MEVGPSRLKAAYGFINQDFISKLPDPILLHILSFLTMKDAIQTGLLSKTWRSIWTSLPYLIFDIDFMAEYNSSRDKEKRINHSFLEMINKIALNRCKQQIINLDKFHLVIPADEIFETGERFQTKLNRWLSKMPHIKELELDLRYNCYPGELATPSKILSSKSLRVMSLSGFNLLSLSNLGINFTSLQTMHFRDALLNDDIMQQLILGCPLLKDLSLNFCHGLKIVYVTGLVKLKQFTIFHTDMDKLDIDSPGLEILEISSPPGLKLNIETCACLRKLLLLDGDFITDQWLSCLISRCTFLEDLDIGHSGGLKNLKITSNSLKMFTLNGSDNLVAAEINAPRLERFIFRLNRSYLTGFPTCLLNASHTMEVQLVLDFLGIGDLYYNQLTKFLANFNHVKTIELCGSLDKIIIPKKKRDHLVSPLYAMKHLVLFAWGKGMKFQSVELLEYMLWLCPQVESLWIKTGTSSDNVETEIVLKLFYEYSVYEDSSFPCCKHLPVKCWRHCLVEARLKKLVGSVDTISMKKFLLLS